MIYHCALACAVVAAAQWAATQPGRPPHRIDALTANGLISQRLAEALPDDPTVHYNLACSLALLGRGQEALAALEWALGCGYGDVEFLLGDDDLASIREEPRFQALVRELLDRQQSD